jgi:beta-lactamase superfamily II metal-dependent hydrolase
VATQTLGIHIFNVGQGDSILVEFPDGVWGVVDCKNGSPTGMPSALEFLLEKGVTNLAFVCLSHPHADHYSGIIPILEHFADNVGKLWMFRLDSIHWCTFLTVKRNAATTPARRSRFDQLREIFRHYADKLKEDRVELLDANVRLPSIGGVEIDCLAPRPRELGAYQSSLARWAVRPTEYKADENQLSVVLRLKYGQSTVILGADARTESWIDIERERARRGEAIVANLVKVSHHGSKEGYFHPAWASMSRPRITHGAISSGSKYGHPDRGVITALRELQVRLHCTNYAPSCLKTDKLNLSKFEGLSPTAAFQLHMIDESPNTQEIPCDGDLHFHLQSNGEIEFAHELSGLCPFHLPY